MKSNQRSALWPYLIVLGCLFLLSVAAPRSWQDLGQSNFNRSTLAVPPLAATDWPQTTVVQAMPPTEVPLTEPVLTSLPAPTAEAAAEPLPPQRPSTVAIPFLPQLSELIPGLPATLVQTEPTRPSPLLPERLLNQTSEVSIPGPANPLDALTLQLPPMPEAPAERVASDRSVADVASRDQQTVIGGNLPAAETLSLPDATAIRTPASDWPLASDLIARLETLGQRPESAVWAQHVIVELRTLHSIPAGDVAMATATLGRLNELATGGANAANQVADAQLATTWRLTRHALVRRLELWNSITKHQRDQALASTGADRALEVAVASLNSPHMGQSWRNYLMLDEITHLANRSDAQSITEKRQLADLVLNRLRSVARNNLAATIPLAKLNERLAWWTGQPISTQDLLAHIEKYEETSLPTDGQLVADARRRLAWSSDKADQELAQRVEEHYRNANLRMVVSQPLLQRMLPAPPRSTDPVRDRLVGVPVVGSSTTDTTLGLRMIPDQHKLRLGFEANGKVDSRTTATSGPVTFYNRANSNFLVRKLVLLSPTGLHVFPAQAEADINNALTGMSTDYDRVPVVGKIVRNYALKERSELENQANWEARGKVAGQALVRVDGEVDASLKEAERNFRQMVLAPMRKLGLDLTPIALSTTTDRATMRFRIADEGQLGAHTPRPQATSDSLASLQIHESSINNMADKLHLGGRTFTIAQLREHLAKRLGREAQPLCDEIPEDVSITFAKESPLRVRYRDGKLELMVSIAELNEGPRTWRDFAIRTEFLLESKGLELDLVRDKALELKGDAYRGKPELRLRAIFSKAIPRDLRLPLAPPMLYLNPQMADLKFATPIVQDGWIGLSIVPREPSQAGNVARLPTGTKAGGAAVTRH